MRVGAVRRQFIRGHRRLRRRVRHAGNRRSRAIRAAHTAVPSPGRRLQRRRRLLRRNQQCEGKVLVRTLCLGLCGVVACALRDNAHVTQESRCRPKVGDACEGQEQPCGMTCQVTGNCLGVNGNEKGPWPPCNDDVPCCGSCEVRNQCKEDAGGDALALSLCPRVCFPEPVVRGFSGKRCEMNPRRLGQVCYRHKWRFRCKGRNRCAWGRRRINKRWKSVGICKRAPAKPIFNCALPDLCWL